MYQLDDEIVLRHLDDDEYDNVESLAKSMGRSLKVCPTCKGRSEEIPDSGGVKMWVSRTYRFNGEEHECDCGVQMNLFRHYLAANIPYQYMRLSWDAEYERDNAVKADIATWLDQWENMREHGIGLELRGPLGTGKTFAATYVGRELVKKGQRVYFQRFASMIEQMLSTERRDKDSVIRLKSSPFLVLDEVVPPVSDAQHALYAFKLEDIIRQRTDFNLPTMVTTNLTEEQIKEYYPRSFSLLSAKQIAIDMNGEDARITQIARSNHERALSGEIAPIT